MKRRSLLGVMVMMLVAGMATKTWALDESETSALLSFYQSNYQGLNNLAIPWGSNMSKACGDDNALVWGGLTCDTAKEHVIALALDRADLMGTIPNNIDGLSHLQILRLSRCSLSGTVPPSIANLTQLTTLNLQGNYLRLCEASPPDVTPTSCNVAGQNAVSCISGCCGCNAAWVAKGCTSDVAACVPCTAAVPHGPKMELGCSNGRWAIPTSYTGPLVVHGGVLVNGDYTLPRDQVLIFVGWDSYLNVTGKANVRGVIVMFITDPQLKELKLIGSLNRKQVTYLTAGVNQVQGGASVGRSVPFSAHATRSCHNPSSALTGDSLTYTASLRWTNNCNTWWIILLCVSPSILGGLVALFVNLI